MITEANEKIREILETIISYIYQRVMTLDKRESEKEASADIKNYIAAVKSVLDMMDGAADTGEDRMVKGLEEFFGDLNEGNEKTERGS